MVHLLFIQSCAIGAGVLKEHTLYQDVYPGKLLIWSPWQMPVHKDCKAAGMIMLMKVTHKDTADFVFLLVLLMILPPRKLE